MNISYNNNATKNLFDITCKSFFKKYIYKLEYSMDTFRELHERIEFWVEYWPENMRNKSPRIKFYPFSEYVLYSVKLCLRHDNTMTEEEFKKIEYGNIETSLVFSTNSLYDYMNGSNRNSSLVTESEKISSLYNLFGLDLVGVHLKNYIIWDARQQKLSKRHGILLSDLKKLCKVLGKSYKDFFNTPKNMDYSFKHSLIDDAWSQFLCVIDWLIEESQLLNYKIGEIFLPDTSIDGTPLEYWVKEHVSKIAFKKRKKYEKDTSGAFKDVNDHHFYPRWDGGKEIKELLTSAIYAPSEEEYKQFKIIKDNFMNDMKSVPDNNNIDYKEKNTRQKIDFSCTVCYDNIPSYRFDCNHCCLCEDCKDSYIIKFGLICPMCKAGSTSISKVYFS